MIKENRPFILPFYFKYSQIDQSGRKGKVLFVKEGAR